MIVSASYRSDIPAFYGEWFLNRLEAGFCRVANPYGGAPYRVPLAGPQVDGFVFWTRNALPFQAALERLAGAGAPFVLQYTLTGYPRPLETSVVDAAAAVETMRMLARRFGPRALVWRYDPVLLSSLTPPAWHLATFARLAKALTAGPGPASDEVVLSFAQIYAKTRNNLERAAKRHGFTWQDPPVVEKQALLAELAGIAREHGLSASLCSQPELSSEGPLQPARCIDAARLSDLAQRPIAARTKGNRPGCLCSESRDIGAYDSCPHGCVYCYAVRSPTLAKRRYRAHDPECEFLIAPTGR
ncbi:MAG: DUF1848 domain-containing protein [Kiloniellales bacterium]